MPQGIDPPRCGSRRLPSPFPDEIVGRCEPSIVNIKALPAEMRADACERPLTRRWSMFVTPQIQSWPPRTVRGKFFHYPLDRRQPPSRGTAQMLRGIRLRTGPPLLTRLRRTRRLFPAPIISSKYIRMAVLQQPSSQPHCGYCEAGTKCLTMSQRMRRQNGASRDTEFVAVPIERAAGTVLTGRTWLRIGITITPAPPHGQEA